MIGETPVEKKFIFVALPHTSNWDFIYGWLAIQCLGLDVKIFAKDVFFIWPFNYVCHFLGVLPINRRENTNFVESVTEKIKSVDELRFFIAPEGTRDRKAGLKSGYYYIAKNSNIPIVTAGPNFKEKTFTVMPPREAMATFAEDEAVVIDFCKSQNGFYPEKTFT